MRRPPPVQIFIEVTRMSIHGRPRMRMEFKAKAFPKPAPILSWMVESDRLSHKHILCHDTGAEESGDRCEAHRASQQKPTPPITQKIQQVTKDTCAN
ncbi:hypothetical protein QQF64_026427 [Cirrhinus molitorella]|uniref:Uncharacterized protein n=1 Tax=Cirrhinus molitorella TaxID=172907 RepID=A0ABR3N9I3_9TELE